MEQGISGRPVVLLVEDDALLSLNIRLILDHEGYEVILARGGREGLALLDDHPASIDVILTDLIMPEMSGFDVLERVQREHPDLPVIVLTGDTSLHSAIEALRLGAYDFLLKPFNVTAMQTAVDRALERRQLLEQRRQSKRLKVVLERAQSIVQELGEPFAILQYAINQLPLQAENNRLQSDLDTLRNQMLRVGDSLQRIGHITRYATVPYLGRASIVDLSYCCPAKRRDEDGDG